MFKRFKNPYNIGCDQREQIPAMYNQGGLLQPGDHAKSSEALLPRVRPLLVAEPETRIISIPCELTEMQRLRPHSRPAGSESTFNMIPR